MDLIPRVIASAEEACQAAEAITAHRWGWVDYFCNIPDYP